MLARLHLDLIHHLLDVGNRFSELLCLFFLGNRLYRAFEDQRAILCRIVDALIVQVPVALDRSLVVVFDRASRFESPTSPGSPHLGPHSNFIAIRVVRSRLLCQHRRLALLVF